ncbi:MAG: thioredoxin family protein [Polyangiales bacterium]
MDEPTYPVATERELRSAGWGCATLLIVGALILYIVFRIAMNSFGDGLSSEPNATPTRAIAEPSVATPVATEPTTLLRWQSSATAARAQAEREHRPVFVFFVAPWAEDTLREHRMAFTDDEVARLAGAFVMLQIDVTDEKDAENAEWVKRFEVSTLPHLAIVDENLERIVDDVLLPQDSKSVAALMQRALNVYVDRKPAKEAEVPSTADDHSH